LDAEMVQVTYVEYSGTTRKIEAEVGETLMRAALKNEVNGILADCGGALACSTCHVYIAPEWWEAVGPPGDVEQTMLELAVEPEETSRLSCQVALTPALDGLVVRLPSSQL
jgi:2Fe-2S ferredoxin